MEEKKLGKRKCRECKIYKDLDKDYYKNISNINSVSRKNYRIYCKDCCKKLGFGGSGYIGYYKSDRRGEYIKGILKRIYDDDNNVVKKRCGRCNKFKLLDLYYKELSNKIDGVGNICKSCNKLYNSVYINKSGEQRNRDYWKGILIRKYKGDELVNKRCLKCMKWRKLDFGVNNRNKDGFNSDCKKCRNKKYLESKI